MNYKELLYNKDNVLSIYPELAVVLNIYDEIKFDNQTGCSKKKKAERSGLNKAIVINQLNYWNNINENKNRNFFDGHYWSYNSYAGWSETNFPFWSPATVKRIFTSLEKDGIIVSCKNNRLKIDNTKWYRVNYEKLQEIIDVVEKYRTECEENRIKTQNNLHNDQTSGHNDQTMRSECSDDESIVTLPLPEINNIDYITDINNSETTTINAFTSREEVKGDIYAFERKSTPQKQEKSALKVPYIDAQNFTWGELHEHIHVRVTKMFQKHGVDDPEKLEELCKIIEYFYRKYDCGWKRYTILSDKALEGIVVKYLYPSYLLAENDVYSFAMYKKMIDKYFNTDFGKNDKNGYGTKVPVELSLPHFMDDAIRESMAMNSLDMTDCIKSVHVDYYE